MCLAQLQSSLTPLFPNLRRLRIVNANYSLDYLRLFISPSLETLEIFGQGETSRAQLLSFLSAAVVEVSNLSTLILGPGRLSLDVVNACLGFNRLKHLELVDAASAISYQLLKDIGDLDDLTTFVIDAQAVSYSPSGPIILADAQQERIRLEEPTRIRAERRHTEERERRHVEEEEERHRAEADHRLLESEDSLWGFSERPPSLPLIRRGCLRCRRTFKARATTCAPCTEILKVEVETRHKEAQEAELREEAELQRKLEENLRLLAIAEAKLLHQQVDSQLRALLDGVHEVSGNSAEALGKSQEASLRHLFPKLSNLTVCGGAELVQDIIQVVSSNSITILSLELVDSLRDIPPSIPPPQRFLATVDSALHRWAGTLAHVMTHSSVPGVASEIPDKTFGALMRLPRLEHLEISGWKVVSNITETICQNTDTKVSILKVFHLPEDSNAVSIPLSDLRAIAEACPDLQSLRCRLENLSDISNQPGSVPLSHPLETLTVGDTRPSLEFDLVLEVARYVDNLFPGIKEIRPLEDVAQNAEQWRWIDKLVKLRQSARLDDKNRPLA